MFNILLHKFRPSMLMFNTNGFQGKVCDDNHSPLEIEFVRPRQPKRITSIIMNSTWQHVFVHNKTRNRLH